MAEDALLLVERVLGTPASQQELNSAHVHLGSTCRAMAERSKKPEAQAMLGSTPEEQVKVQEWLLWANTQLSPLQDDKLMQINQHLSNRTFLIGSIAPTVADLIIYGVTLPATTTFPIAQHHHYANLLRWADTIQGIVGEGTVLQASLTPLKLHKPPFIPPPPPPPPAAAPAKAAAPANSQPASTSKPAAQQPPAQPAQQPPKAGKEQQQQQGAPAPAPAPDSKGASKKESKGGEGGKKEGKKEEGGAAAPPAEGGKAKKEGGGGGKKEEEEVRIDMLDIRVGQITKVDKHPNADALYLEEIDVGEEKPRQVISGLVKFVPAEEMQGRRVVVICNLKPAKMRDVMSYGMVLCASTEAHDKVVPILPPEGSKTGERVMVPGYDQAPIDEVNPKKKILERLFPDMRTNADGVPCYKGAPFTTSTGQVTSPLPAAHVA